MRWSLQRYLYIDCNACKNDPNYRYLVSRTELEADYEALEKGLERLKQELYDQGIDISVPLEEVSSLEDDQFGTVMREFYREAKRQFEKVGKLKRSATEAFEAVVKFYAEDPVKTQPDEFFDIFKRFMSSWQKCQADLDAARQKRENIEKQKRLQEQRRGLQNKTIDITERKEDTV